MLRPLQNSFLYLELLIILPRRKLACYKENIAHHEGHSTGRLMAEIHEVFYFLLYFFVLFLNFVVKNSIPTAPPRRTQSSRS